jgi:GGDEF domain-containing protein
VVLMVEAGSMGVELLRSRLSQALAAYNAWPKQHFTLSMSAGASHLAVGETRSIEDLLAEADRRMYEEKRR